MHQLQKKDRRFITLKNGKVVPSWSLMVQEASKSSMKNARKYNSPATMIMSLSIQLGFVAEKTDWAGYVQVLVVAGLVAYIIGHLVISL